MVLIPKRKQEILCYYHSFDVLPKNNSKKISFIKNKLLKI